MHKQENHQVRDSEAVQRGGEEDADVHLVLNGGRGEGIGGHRARPARVHAEVLHGRGQLGHDRQEHAAQPLNEKINSARHAQLFPHVCASESFGAGHEGPPDQSPLRSTRSDNHRRH